MQEFVATILARKRNEIDAASKRFPLSLMATLAEEAPAVNSLYVSLQIGAQPKLMIDLGRRYGPEDKYDPLYEPNSWAHHMLQRGAAAFSVPTDQEHFGGQLDDFRAVRSEFDCPLLRREFVVDEYQIYESRAAGADSFTLYLALHDFPSLQYHLEVGRELGMEPLLLARDEKELDRALKSDALMVGITLMDSNLNRLIGYFRDATRGDNRICRVLDASLMSRQRLGQFVLDDFRAVIYSHRSLGYEYLAQRRNPNLQPPTKE